VEWGGKLIRSLSRPRHHAPKTQADKAVLELLMDGEPLPPEFKDHPLRGNFVGSRDCHVGPDWILIYTLSEKDTHVCFERTGTHSDLFR
jgi:mRNA interferase YafQ